MTPIIFKEEIIRPVLKEMDMWSEAAESLLLGTAIHESGGLKALRQNGGGPALSYFQIEPATLYDLYDNYLSYRPSLREKLEQFQLKTFSIIENLTLNPAYATAAARLQYYRVPEALPETLDGQAAYWKKYWNTKDGKGTAEQYIKHYNHFEL